MAQEQKHKGGGGSGDESSGKESGGQKLAKRGEELKEEMDALVDEIDEVLEENAEEFVQRGARPTCWTMGKNWGRWWNACGRRAAWRRWPCCRGCTSRRSAAARRISTWRCTQ